MCYSPWVRELRLSPRGDPRRSAGAEKTFTQTFQVLDHITEEKLRMCQVLAKRGRTFYKVKGKGKHPQSSAQTISRMGPIVLVWGFNADKGKVARELKEVEPGWGCAL